MNNCLSVILFWYVGFSTDKMLLYDVFPCGAIFIQFAIGFVALGILNICWNVEAIRYTIYLTLMFGLKLLERSGSFLYILQSSTASLEDNVFSLSVCYVGNNLNTRH